jgi:hypothetical protein
MSTADSRQGWRQDVEGQSIAWRKEVMLRDVEGKVALLLNFLSASGFLSALCFAKLSDFLFLDLSSVTGSSSASSVEKNPHFLPAPGFLSALSVAKPNA